MGEAEAQGLHLKSAHGRKFPRNEKKKQQRENKREDRLQRERERERERERGLVHLETAGAHEDVSSGDLFCVEGTSGAWECVKWTAQQGQMHCVASRAFRDQ